MDKELNEFGEPYPTLSEMEAKYAELYKNTLSYHSEQLRKSVVELGRIIWMELLAPVILSLRTISNWIYPIDKKPAPKEEKRVSIEGFVRILYLRTRFHRNDCEKLAITIFSAQDQIDMLEFTICASNIGYEVDDVLREFIHHGYYYKIKDWREQYPAKLWDCTLTASDFQNPKELLGDNVLIRHDGEILVIEDAPPMEMLGKRKNS